MDPSSVVPLFAASAIAKDENHTYHGTDEVRRWRAEAASKYTYTCQSLHVTQEGQSVPCELPSRRLVSQESDRVGMLL